VPKDRPLPRVLVVDDEEHISEMVAMGLGYNGFEVERAASGRAALAAAETRRPDLIVLDVMLPDLDGFEVTRRLRQVEGAGRRVPIIFLTARDTTADKIEGLRLGSDDYVTKPFSIEELIERVKAVLRRSAGAGDYTFSGNASVLETYISYLRHKIDEVDPPLIHTVRGVGYSLRLPPDR
jgi:two-component system OmpR family response regulator